MVLVALLELLIRGLTVAFIWRRRIFSVKLNIIATVLILLFGAYLIFWIYYFIARPDKKSTEFPVLQPFANPDSNQPEREPGMSSQFFELINGAHGKELMNAYNEIRKIFILKANGECGGAGFIGKMFDSERAKRLQKIDDKYVIPVIGNDAGKYRIWWMSVYMKLKQEMSGNQNAGQSSFLGDVLRDVEAGDSILDAAGVLGIIENHEDYSGNEKYENVYEEVTLKAGDGTEYTTPMAVCIRNGAEKIDISTSRCTVKVRRKHWGVKDIYTVNGAYAYFKDGLSDDEMIRMAEILIAVTTILQWNDCKQVNRTFMEEYALPSLSKLN